MSIFVLCPYSLSCFTGRFTYLLSCLAILKELLFSFFPKMSCQILGLASCSGATRPQRALGGRLAIVYVVDYILILAYITEQAFNIITRCSAKQW